jgi:hypothetical protein
MAMVAAELGGDEINECAGRDACSAALRRPRFDFRSAPILLKN